jgi:hypothetical protein
MWRRMMKKLFKCALRKDFGTDCYVQVLNIRRWSLLQVSVSWNDYPSFPYVQIKSGSGSLLSIIFWADKFGFDVDILSRTWNWDYMNNIDDNECNYD